MKFRPDRKMKDLIWQLQRANEHLEEGRWNEARKILRQARSFARERGLPYGELAWKLCVCLDNLGQVEEAFRMGIEAIDQQPLSPRTRESFLIVAKRLGEMIEADVKHSATPRRYALLAENDVAESGIQVAMARHLIHSGEIASAADLLEAVTTLCPNQAEAWRLRAELARSQGHEEEAGRMELEALASENAVTAAVEVR